MRALALALLFCSTPALPASVMIEAPHAKPHMAKVDWALSASIVGLRVTDYLRTTHCLDNRTCSEKELPNWLVNNHPAFLTEELGVAAVSVFTQYELTKHGHRTLARIGQSINIGMTAPSALGADFKY